MDGRTLLFGIGAQKADHQAAADKALREAFGEDPHMARHRSDNTLAIRNLDQSVDFTKALYSFYETLFSQQSFDRVTRFLDLAPSRAIPSRP